MQKMILFVTIFLGAGFSANAQKTPPPPVVTMFNQMFIKPDGLKWKKERKGEWEAEFKLSGLEMSANFNAKGKWLETETEINPVELPAPVLDALKGKKIKEASRILRADGALVFEAEVRHKDLLYDGTGKLLPADKE